jgi:hypothetical protein
VDTSRHTHTNTQTLAAKNDQLAPHGWRALDLAKPKSESERERGREGEGWRGVTKKQRERERERE